MSKSEKIIRLPRASREIPCYPMVEDRHALVLKPRMAFWDWVNDHNWLESAVRPKPEDGKVYLITDHGDMDRWIDRHWRRVMEDEMATWCRDSSVWPAVTREQFDAWFRVETHLVIYDTVGKGLRRMHFPPRVIAPGKKGL